MESLAYLDVERLHYWQGQMLRSRDFNDQGALAAQMRWWHNRVIHRAYGVRLGLEVEATDLPRRGVNVKCGVAYDCLGRELVLRRDTSVELPESLEGGDLLLFIRRKEVGPAGRTARGSCCPEKCSAKQDYAELIWKSARGCGPSAGVALARLADNKGGRARLAQDLFPRIVRALARPHVASGTTLPSNTPWEDFFFDDAHTIRVGVQTRIDTSAAGFTETPCYFAWLETMPNELSDDLSTLPLLSLPTGIAEASATGFRFQILSGLTGRGRRVAARARRVVTRAASTKLSDLPSTIGAFATRARKIGLRVCWLGCQMSPERPPCGEECDCGCAGA